MTLERSLRHLRHAARLLLKAPRFTIAAVGTIALGIGANVAMFSLTKAVVLEPLPYGDPDGVVLVWNAVNREGTTNLSVREILSYGDEARSLEHLAGYMETSVNLTGGSDPERVRAAAVTDNLFTTLGVAAQIGRGFAPGESDPGSPAVVVLGHDLWQRRYGGAPDIIGRSIPVNGRPRQVIGIMPPAFQLPLDYRATRPSEVWVPLIVDRANLEHWGSRSYFGVGRLKRGASPSQATSEFAVIGDRWVQAGYIKPSPDDSLTRAAVPVQEFVVGNLRRPVAILLGAVGLVLIMACANLVNLLLARADQRRREIAVRGALGAGRGELVWQLLTESLLLSTIGALGGLVLAHGALRVLVALRPEGLPRVETTTLDASALAFGGVLAVVTGILFGVAPAIQLTRQQFASVLNEAGRGTSLGRTRVMVRRSLVVAQLAGSVVLVVAAGLLLRTLVELNRVDLGFNPKNVLTAQLQLPLAGYPENENAVAFYRTLLERLENIPGVVAAGAARILPIARTIGDWSITIEGRALLTPNENPNGDFQAVTPGYFQAMQTKLVAGRFLTNADREDAPLVVLVNDTMAARYWPGQDPLGRRFHMGGEASGLPLLTIVGVVGTSRHDAIVEAPRAEMYLPYAQLPRSVGGASRSLALVIRTAGDPVAYVGPLREAVRSLDASLPLAEVQSMEQVTATALARPRFAAVVLAVFALLALTLAALGTYATISLLVAERSHEIGIRMALGAGRRTILALVLGEGLLLTAAGIGFGVAGAAFVTRIMATLLYGVVPLDPLTFAAGVAVLAAVAGVASVTPARRAASLDPMHSLRHV